MTFQPTRHSTVTSTYRSVNHKAVSGDAGQAVPVADGSINSGQITTFHLQTSGGVLSTMVTEGQCYGPCRLSDNNNNRHLALCIHTATGIVGTRGIALIYFTKTLSGHVARLWCLLHA